MKLVQLKYFKTVAEFERITRAAKALYVSPPALSATIANLEKELGVTLFDRTSNRIVLNEQGKIFLRYVDKVFDDLDCAKIELQKSLQGNDNSVQIAVTTSNLWISLISAFSLEYPQIMLSCTTLKISQLRNQNLSRLYAFVLAESNDFPSAEMESICLHKEALMKSARAVHRPAQETLLELMLIPDEMVSIISGDGLCRKRPIATQNNGVPPFLAGPRIHINYSLFSLQRRLRSARRAVALRHRGAMAAVSPSITAVCSSSTAADSSLSASQRASLLTGSE